MCDFLFRPRRIPRTGDDSPAGSLFRYLWRMSGRHQLWICLLALVVAALNAVPPEQQRRLVDAVIKDRETALLWTLGGGYLAVLQVQGGAQSAPPMSPSSLSESAIRHNRAPRTATFAPPHTH